MLYSLYYQKITGLEPDIVLHYIVIEIFIDIT